MEQSARESEWTWKMGLSGNPKGLPSAMVKVRAISISVFSSLDVYLSGSRHGVSRVVINEIVVLLGEVNNVQETERAGI